MHEGEWLSPIVCEPAALKREASTRRKPYEEISIPKGGTKEHGDEGWEVVRELKTRVVLRRQRPHDERLEDRVWYLLYLLGYRELSMGRNFRVRIERKGSEPVWRQIDVLAKDDETSEGTASDGCCQDRGGIVGRTDEGGGAYPGGRTIDQGLDYLEGCRPVVRATHHWNRLYP